MALNDRRLARLTMAMPDVGVRLSGKLQAFLYQVSAGRLGGFEISSEQTAREFKVFALAPM